MLIMAMGRNLEYVCRVLIFFSLSNEGFYFAQSFDRLQYIEIVLKLPILVYWWGNWRVTFVKLKREEKIKGLISWIWCSFFLTFQKILMNIQLNIDKYKLFWLAFFLKSFLTPILQTIFYLIYISWFENVTSKSIKTFSKKNIFHLI